MFRKYASYDNTATINSIHLEIILFQINIAEYPLLHNFDRSKGNAAKFRIFLFQIILL